jgi:Protein of unknown function (DUF1573)
MPSKTKPLPKGQNTLSAPSPKRHALPIYLAGAAILVIIAGIVLLTTRGAGRPAAGAPVQVTGQPKLALDREQINFGRVPLDKPVKATFKLTNAGDQPLRILSQPVVEVKQGC